MKIRSSSIRCSSGKITLTSNLAMLVLTLVAAERFYDKFVVLPETKTPSNPVYVLYSVNGDENTKKEYWDRHYMDGNLDGFITSGEAQRDHDFTWVTMSKTRPIYDLLKTCSSEEKELIYGLTYPVAVQAVKLSKTEKEKLLKLDLISRVNNLNSRFNINLNVS